ncbi:MAG TPA: phytanoyl-CoA dioxygenase family protein, partial [Pirellulaceae bacterium]
MTTANGVIEDLSTRHMPVSNLLRWPATPEERLSLRLSPDQLDFYEANGFLGGVRLLEDWQLDRLCEDLKELMDPSHAGRELWYEYHVNESSDPNGTLFHALGAWRLRPGLHDILWNPAFVVPAEQLLGGAVRFWHDQLF